MRLLILPLVVSLSAGAQQPVPKRYLAEDMRLESKDLNKKWLWPVGAVLVAPIAASSSGNATELAPTNPMLPGSTSTVSPSSA